MSDVSKVFAANLRRLKKEQGGTFTWLADTAGVSRPTVWRVAEGKSGTSLTVVHAIARALGMKLDDLTTEPEASRG